ncbi:NUMOD4 motif-containing HNH endonuclease [Klebsiella pneumoniae]|uniref:NUMOD4 motif-containing HNH endonuclease n=1 Tax=Klebsiella pneumoniae TaxID=573 RepID=UPI001E5A004A|nr:NUMOD4 motif-containing HNH endonuclease [Klebsiella pneumoniae]MCE3583289.1 NUMOD4 motif-containing HNH endonuclease [Klebsiella pneumoniae]HBY8809042.1 HNH endonuclease [Klebsiella pneumoniae]HBY9897228.1 HNH endonuclease [Klebsiella pneumoniae]HBY9946459.1 HNH endonuclease [Klebsiella pneumoniae]
MFDDEVWKETAVSRDYEVSSKGRFRSVDRVIETIGGYSKGLSGMPIKPFKVQPTGYLQVKICGKKYLAHRLVALAFCEGFANGLVVNHKNGDRADNRAENLEWVTSSENIKHAYRELGVIPEQLGKYGEDNNASKVVIATCKITGKEIRYGAAMDAVRDGFDSSCISRCCNGKSVSHKGYYWRFEEASHAQPAR